MLRKNAKEGESTSQELLARPKLPCVQKMRRIGQNPGCGQIVAHPEAIHVDLSRPLSLNLPVNSQRRSGKRVIQARYDEKVGSCHLSWHVLQYRDKNCHEHCDIELRFRLYFQEQPCQLL
jgi:hypothetical protein